MNKNNKVFVIIIIIFIIHSLFLSWSFYFENVDDAFISFRYGKNLLNGEGIVFNKGEYVEGYTNFLWTIFMAPYTNLSFINVSIAAIIFGILFTILNLIIVRKIISGFFNHQQKYPVYFLLLPVIYMALDGSIAFWSIAGMEFPCYTFFILMSTYFYFRIRDSNNNLYFTTAFLILCTLSRPEGNLIFLIFLTHMFFFRRSYEDFYKKFFTLIIIYSVFAILYYGFKYIYYGNILPNTFYAKGAADISANLKNGLEYLTLCYGSRAYLFIFILFIPFKSIFNDRKISFLLFFCAVYSLYILAIGGDWITANRFFVPILPFLFILTLIGYKKMIEKLISSNSGFENVKRKILPGVSIVSVILLFVFTISFLEYDQLISKGDNAKVEMQRSEFGKWLKQNADPNTIIAAGPAGKIPYYSELYTIDMWGLNNKYIARTKLQKPDAGHRKFDLNYVLSFNPEFIIGTVGFDENNIPPRYEKFDFFETDNESIEKIYRLRKEFREFNK